MGSLLPTLVLASVVSSGHDHDFTISDSSMSVLGKDLEKTKLVDIQNSFGRTIKYKSGDAAESEARLNYFLPKEGAYLVFASGAMGGGEILTHARLEKKISEPFLKIPLGLNPGDFCGVRIGDSKKQAEAKLNIKLVGDTIRIINERDLMIRGLPFSESKGLYLIFKKDSLDEATIWKVTIN